MIDINNIDNVYFVEGRTDFRCGINRLVALAQGYGVNLDERTLLIFCNKTKSSVKIIHWESNGIWLYQKSLTTDKFVWIKGSNTVNLTTSSLLWLLQGLSPIQSKSYENKSCDIYF